MLDQRAPHRPWTVTAFVIAAIGGTTLAASPASTAGCTLGALQALNIRGLDNTAATNVVATATAPHTVTSPVH